MLKQLNDTTSQWHDSRKERGTIPHPKFLAVGKMSGNF